MKVSHEQLPALASLLVHLPLELIPNYLDKITNLHCSAFFTSRLSENKQDMIARVQVPTNIQIRNSSAEQECITPLMLC